MKVRRIVISWILPIVVGLLFVAVGVVKFVDPSWRANFARWGYPDYFYAVTAIIEVVGGLALFVPLFRFYAAVALTTVMLAAILTVTLHGEPRFARTAFVYLIMVGAILWTHRK